MSIKQENKRYETDVLFQNRWSPRAFDAKKHVPETALYSCLEAARWAPSCFGAEPWRFIVCQRDKNEEIWKKLLGCLVPKNQEWAQYAPVLLMVCTHQVFEHNAQKNNWAEYDAGAASVSFCLQASALGLVTHQMGGFDADKVRTTFALPEDFKPIAAIALGYQGDEDVLGEAFQAIEIASRKRKNIEDIAFFDGWTSENP